MFEVESTLGRIPVQRDEAPELDTDAPIPGADDEAPFGRTASGRIRKRPVGSNVRQSGASNEKLARQAAKTLVQLHSILAVPLMMVGLVQTAAALSDEDRNAQFEEQVYAALLPDPSLCRSILRAGGASAKTSLIIAYSMFGASIAMTAYPEIKQMRDYRKSVRDTN